MPRIEQTNIGIIGTRHRDTIADERLVKVSFAKLVVSLDLPNRSIKIISGGCSHGADRFAEIIAKEGWSITIHYPRKMDMDPDLKLNNPRYAFAQINYARNTLVAQDSLYLIACVDADRKGGTEDTITKWTKLNPKNPERLILV